MSAEPLVTPAFASALARLRPRLNAGFEQTRHLNPRLEGDAVKEWLLCCLNPIMESLPTVAPERYDEILAELYALGLELMAQDLLGRRARIPEINEVWNVLLPGMAQMICESPRILVGSFTNAAFNLVGFSGVDVQGWLRRLLSAVPALHSLDQALGAGVVAAWRSGMAHLRARALEVAAQLDPAVTWRLLEDRLEFPSSLEAPEVFLAFLASMRADPWAAPAAVVASLGPSGSTLESHSRLTLVSSVGGFRGFGGPFLVPPRVYTCRGELIAEDDTQRFWVNADRFGATFVRPPFEVSPDAATSSPPFELRDDGMVTNSQESRHFRILRSPSSFAVTEHTLAVTLGRSHRLYLVAMSGGPLP